jgi:hypothetical protein
VENDEDDFESDKRACDYAFARLCNGLGRGCLGCAASVSGRSDEAEG